MRPETEIRAMRDAAESVILRRGGEADRTAFTILDWVCDPYALTTDVMDLLDGPNPDADLDDTIDILHGLPQVVTTDNRVEVNDYLYRAGEQRLTELAAAARRLDRLCRAELKKRGTSK